MKRVIRFIVRFICLIGGLLFYYMERIGNWFINYKSKTEYVREGKCRKCGRCCRLLAIEYPRFFNRSKKLLTFTRKWHELRYGFHYEGKRDNFLIYRCTFMDNDGRCRIYRMRPRLCREYPKWRLYGKTPTHAECGFYFVRRDGKGTFDKALRKAGDRIDKRSSIEKSDL